MDATNNSADKSTCEQSQSKILSDFALAEYKEAANAYFKGVDVGYSTIKQYIAVNGTLFAAFGTTFIPEKILNILPRNFEIIIAITGVLLSFVMIRSIKRYFEHLENCRYRCEEIEKKYEGRLFTELGSISKNTKSGMTTDHSLKLITYAVGAFWISIATYTTIFKFII